MVYTIHVRKSYPGHSKFKPVMSRESMDYNIVSPPQGFAGINLPSLHTMQASLVQAMTDNLCERDKTVSQNYDLYVRSNVLDQDTPWFLPIPGFISSTGHRERES